MTWSSFFSGIAHVVRVITLLILKILMFVLNLVFSIIKFLLLFLVFFLTLGKLGANTMDLGSRRRGY